LRELILRGLDDLEDYYLAAEVLEKIRKGEDILRNRGIFVSPAGVRRCRHN